MAKERTRKQTASSIRLLILFFLFSFYPGYIYAEVEEDLELSFSSSPLFIDSVFEVKIKLDEYSYKSSDEPKLIILDEDEALEFLDSGINSLYGGILITNKYRLKKIGNFELIPHLSLGKNQTKLKIFLFRWNLRPYQRIQCLNGKYWTQFHIPLWKILYREKNISSF